MKKQSTDDTAQPALQRDPEDWKTGDEPMTDAQRSYLETLCRETGEEFDDALTKAEASKRIDELRERSPRLEELNLAPLLPVADRMRPLHEGARPIPIGSIVPKHFPHALARRVDVDGVM